MPEPPTHDPHNPRPVPTPSSEDILNSWLRVPQQLPPTPAQTLAPRNLLLADEPDGPESTDLVYDDAVYQQALDMGYSSDDILSCFAHLQTDDMPTDSLDHLLETLNNLDQIRDAAAAAAASGGEDGDDEDEADDEAPVGAGVYEHFFHSNGRRLLVWYDPSVSQRYWLNDEVTAGTDDGSPQPTGPTWEIFPDEWESQGTFIEADPTALSTENAEYGELGQGGELEGEEGAVQYHYFVRADNDETYLTCVVNGVMYYTDDSRDEWALFPPDLLALGSFVRVPDETEVATTAADNATSATVDDHTTGVDTQKTEHPIESASNDVKIQAEPASQQSP